MKKIKSYLLLALQENPKLTDGLLLFNKTTGQWEAIDISAIVNLLNVAGEGYSTPGQVRDALRTLVGDDRLSLLDLKDQLDTSGFLLKSELENELNFGEDSTAWNCNDQRILYAKATLTANLVPVFSGHEDGANKLVSRERTYILNVTGTCALTLPKHFFRADQLPDGVSWDAPTKVLTIPGDTGTRWLIWGTLDKTADELMCNIQQK